MQMARGRDIPAIGEPPDPGKLDFALVEGLTRDTDHPLIAKYLINED